MDEQINYIKSQALLNWDEYFMLQALIASFRSKDPVTKVGCVFVDQNNHQLSMGYNGFVAGIDESKLPWGKNKEVALIHQKYAYVVHSEANAILHAKTSLEGSRLYVTHFPCHECAKMISTVGVTEIIYLNNKHKGSESNDISKRIFELAQIQFRKLTLSADLIQNIFQVIKESQS